MPCTGDAEPPGAASLTLRRGALPAPGLHDVLLSCRAVRQGFAPPPPGRPDPHAAGDGYTADAHGPRWAGGLGALPAARLGALPVPAASLPRWRLPQWPLPAPPSRPRPPAPLARTMHMRVGSQQRMGQPARQRRPGQSRHAAAGAGGWSREFLSWGGGTASAAAARGTAVYRLPAAWNQRARRCTAQVLLFLLAQGQVGRGGAPWRRCPSRSRTPGQPTVSRPGQNCRPLPASPDCAPRCLRHAA